MSPAPGAHTNAWPAIAAARAHDATTRTPFFVAVPGTAALLVGWGLWTGLAGVASPELIHRDRDGTAPFFRANSGAEEWTRLLPSYVLGEVGRQRLALVWATVLGVALFTRGARPTARSVGLSLLGLLAAAGVASRFGAARSGGRDAVRLAGRPALGLPGFSAFALAPARWGPEVLAWGPLFEPHRHPGGATIGERLRLPAGRYALTLDAEPQLPLSQAPELTIRGEGPEVLERVVGLVPAAGLGWSGEFTIEPGETAGVRLALRGGSPFVLKAIGLMHSTLSDRTGLIR